MMVICSLSYAHRILLDAWIRRPFRASKTNERIGNDVVEELIGVAPFNLAPVIDFSMTLSVFAITGFVWAGDIVSILTLRSAMSFAIQPSGSLLVRGVTWSGIHRPY
ncbi:hypothetical protein HOE425_290059 [Hoeflea sp. EC-HK425]|nr:hypothetical protein HOE425_290059 [Hoeflea sp. EC-HK425]